MRSLLLIIMLSSTFQLSAQVGQPEVCNNAVDDDGDGLTDLNDPDCNCPLFEPISLIPNPSFEEQKCCPQGRSQLQCAEDWIQASPPTTDYLHTCEWLGWAHLPPPLPFPDGEACIGFRNGRISTNETSPNWKEYVGACLTEPLRAGHTYRLEFYLGFTHRENSPPINLSFFGSENCSNLPFGEDTQHGCPLNGPGWVLLDQVFALGDSAWVKQTFQVTPASDIYAVVIGPDCEQLTMGPETYYFLDDLVLADEIEFEFMIRPDSNPCAPDFSLRLPARDSLAYQWYRDGIALVGETSPTLTEEIEDGKYQVLVTGNQSCRLTRPFIQRRQQFVDSYSLPLCAGSGFDFLGQTLTMAGEYRDTLISKNGCDSIIIINLFDAVNVSSTQEIRIFPGETITIGAQTFDAPTEEVVMLPSSTGCDSVVNLLLEYYKVFVPNGFSPNGDGLNDHFGITGGNDLISVNQLTIVDRWGAIFYQSNSSSTSSIPWDGNVNGRPAATGTYLYTAEVLMNDGKERRLSGTVHLIR